VRRCVTTALAMLLLASVGLAQQSPAFSSKVEAVRVDVLVTDNGQPVRGLVAEVETELNRISGPGPA